MFAYSDLLLTYNADPILICIETRKILELCYHMFKYDRTPFFIIVYLTQKYGFASPPQTVVQFFSFICSVDQIRFWFLKIRDVKIVEIAVTNFIIGLTA